MLNSAEISMLLEATGVSVYMTLASTLMAYVIGLPVGILLVVCAPGGLKPKAVLHKVLDIVVNITRSIPFLILMLLATPLARLITGKSYGANATIISLTLAAAPFIARLVESSLLEVDRGVIEAAQSMGAGTFAIVRKVLIGEARVSLIVGSTIALGTVLGYTAMSGAIGGGGLGDVAIRYGYSRWDTRILLATVVLLVILMQLIQFAGTKLSRKLDRRLTG
ncbi:MAG TPA: ABC transporter permease [Candidatus Eisenbergiella merdigallinarum]|uniref:ABC transporter permease n=1 Tax=Candidatus Eisenbergiella merdigallinarum TaxID=2838552 RepID=A0A9D2SEK6_9FIRM|nr:ABC transporter permease [Candidatus Eisenbergiella merdigallinarum]